MLNVCYSVSTKLSLQFNCSNAIILHLVAVLTKKYGPLLLGSDTVSWVNSVKYLGVHVVSGRKLSFDITPVKRPFLWQQIQHKVSVKEWRKFYGCLCLKPIAYLFSHMQLLLLN